MKGALQGAAGVRSGEIVSRSVCFAAFTVGFFFSFRAALAMISAHWLQLGSEPGVVASLVIEFTLLLAISLQAIGPAARSAHWIFRQPTVRWVLIFLSFSCFSLLWSTAVSRPASFLYWCAMAADVMIVVLLLREGPAAEVADSLMRGFIASTCMLAVTAWIMPVTDDLRLGDPDYFNTNQIANLCAMAIFISQLRAALKNEKWVLPTVFLTVTMLRSLSKATIIAFVMAQGSLMIYDKSISVKKKAVIAAFTVLLTAMFSGLIASYLDLYATTGNQAETLTGRTAIWAYTVDVSLAKPWFGNGMDAMWKVFPPFGKEMFEARHAENELLQQFFAYGVVGVIMLVGLYGGLLRSIFSLPTGPAKGVLIAIMLFILVRGLAEAEPFDLLLPLWMITLMSCIVRSAETNDAHCETLSPLISPTVTALTVQGSQP